MMNGKTLLAVVGVLAFCGCETAQVKPANNATISTAGGPLIQAHRGGRYEYQDNAAGGFKRCIAKGIRGFETDVRFTKDHQLVVMHDSNVARTTDGNGVVEAMTLAELKKLHLKDCSEPVPTVEEVMLALDRRDDIFIELEMKAYPGDFYTPMVLEEYCRKLNAAAKSLLAPGTYAFTSFSAATLKAMRNVDANAPIGFIMGEKLTDRHIYESKAIGCTSIAPGLSTPRAMVARAHAEGLTVCMWMVQNAAQYAEAKRKGADRVTSDYPHLLDLTVRGNRKKVVVLDLNSMLCTPQSQITKKNLEVVKSLCGKYKCVISTPIDASQAIKQLKGYQIDVVSSSGDTYDAVLKWAKAHDYGESDLVFVGHDFADGGNDSAIRIKGMDHIVVSSYKEFAGTMSILLK